MFVQLLNAEVWLSEVEPAYVQLSALNTTDVKPVQPLKASSPMLSTEFGIVTDVSPVQP